MSQAISAHNNDAAAEGGEGGATLGNNRIVGVS